MRCTGCLGWQEEELPSESTDERVITAIVYNTWLKNKHFFKVEPKFYRINFDDLTCSHHCNPLDLSGMDYITDASEFA